MPQTNHMSTKCRLQWHRHKRVSLGLTLPEQDVADSGVHVVVDGVSAVDHQAVDELHGLGPLPPELARDDHLATLGTALHDEAQDTVAGPEDDGSPQ